MTTRDARARALLAKHGAAKLAGLVAELEAKNAKLDRDITVVRADKACAVADNQRLLGENERLVLALRWINVRDCRRFGVAGCIDEGLPMGDWCGECLAHHALDGGTFPEGDDFPSYPAADIKPTALPMEPCGTCDGAGCPVCRPRHARRRSPRPPGCVPDPLEPELGVPSAPAVAKLAEATRVDSNAEVGASLELPTKRVRADELKVGDGFIVAGQCYVVESFLDDANPELRARHIRLADGAGVLIAPRDREFNVIVRR